VKREKTKRGTQCAFEGCERLVMSKTGRTLCREHQRNNQSAGFALPLSIASRVKQMSVKEDGEHLLSLLRRVCDFDVSPVKRYIPGTPEFEKLARLYA